MHHCRNFIPRALTRRELLAREQPPFRWPDVFRTLRIMELSGEVLAGYFFEGIAGPQFMSPQALRLFRGGLAGNAVFWVSAVDPASVCGLAVDDGLIPDIDRPVAELLRQLMPEPGERPPAPALVLHSRPAVGGLLLTSR